MGPSGRIRRRIWRRWGAVARTSCGATRACGSAARKGRLAGGVGIVGTVSFRKGRVQECRRRRSRLLASERAESFLLGSGRPSRESSESFQGFGSSKFPVERTLGYLRPPGWRPEDGGGDGSRQESASASGGTVQSDQRRGASETGTIPTARVCHKERFRARPHPSPEPARWSACTSGRRAGGNSVSGPCRAAREFIGLEPCPRGTTTCTGGWRRKLAKACTARGGAAGAVLGRHGGG